MGQPHTNLTAVGLIVRGGKIFIAKRAATKVIFPDQYELPGGHIDPGEQPAEALRREIHEEFGVGITVGRPVDAFTYESEGMFKIEVAYFCTLEDSAAEPTIQPAEHSEAKWIGPDEIDQFEKEDEETAVLRKAFKILEGEGK